MTHRLDKVIDRLTHITFTGTFTGEHEELFNLLELAHKACVSDSQVAALERIFLSCAAWARRLGVRTVSFRGKIKQDQNIWQDGWYNPTLMSDRRLDYALVDYIGSVASTLRYKSVTDKIDDLKFFLPMVALFAAEKLTRIEEKEKQ